MYDKEYNYVESSVEDDYSDFDDYPVNDLKEPLKIEEKNKHDNPSPDQVGQNGNPSNIPTVEIKGKQVVIGGKTWREKSKYDWVVSSDEGGGKWIYDKAKSDLDASTLGAALILAFASEEGGWGKGNNQSVTHNQFSLLQQTPNGQTGTAHGYPIIYESFSKGFNAFYQLLKEKYPDFLPLLKQDNVTADDINKALRSGPHHQRGGYTNSDKGKALTGVLKYAIVYTSDIISRELKQKEILKKEYEEKLKIKTNELDFTDYWNRLQYKFQLYMLNNSIEKDKKEMNELSQAYENLNDKF